MSNSFYSKLGYYFDLSPFLIDKKNAIKISHCSNPKCSQNKSKLLNGSFCSICGSAIETYDEVQIISNYFDNWYDFAEKYDLVDFMCHIENNSGHFLIPNLNNSELQFIQIEESNSTIDLSNYDYVANKKHFIKFHQKIINALEKEYNEKPLIKFGVVCYYS
jgi:hypothetical protein